MSCEKRRLLDSCKCWRARAPAGPTVRSRAFHSFVRKRQNRCGWVETSPAPLLLRGRRPVARDFGGAGGRAQRQPAGLIRPAAARPAASSARRPVLVAHRAEERGQRDATQRGRRDNKHEQSPRRIKIHVPHTKFHKKIFSPPTFPPKPTFPPSNNIKLIKNHQN